ncbi:hypothetical protein [Bradyrhizobium liaoningense]
MTTHVHHVTTITQVAKDLQAFTDFGIENLIELIRFYKENPGLLRR